ncbi:MAG: hypothetical protein PHE88_07640 [Elusimicrobia bacterium]|nr:hypothetical protein [Elusimicrobiota bacterium]
MKKIILFLLLIIILTIGVYYFERLEIFTTSLKYLAQSQLTGIIKSNVKIEKATWLPFNKIIFKKIAFDGFSCDEVVVSFNLKKINRGINSVEKITLNSPKINYGIIKELLQKRTPSKSKSKSPVLSILINSGAISYDGFDITNVYVEAVPKGNIFAIKSNLYIVIKDKSYFSGNMKLAGTISKDLMMLKLKCEANDLVFKQIKPFNGSININGDINNLNLSGNMESEEAVVKMKSKLNLKDLKFTSYLSGNIYNLQSFTGKLLSYTTYPYILDGPLSFDGYFEFPDLKLNVNLNKDYIKSTDNAINIKDMKTSLNYYKDEWIINSTATVLNSDIVLNGKISKDILDLYLYANNLNIKSDYFAGKISLSTKISGTVSKPKIAGKITASEFAIGQKSPKSAYGKYFWENDLGYLKINGSGFSVNLEADKKKISNCKIKYDATIVTLSGKYDKINFKTENIDASLFNKNLSGFISLSGRVLNVFSGNYNFYANFLSPLITINRSSTSISGIISYSKDSMHIQNLSLDGLSGDIKIMPDKKETTGYLTLSKCNSNLVFPFIGIGPEIISGSISGKINWNGRMNNPNPYGTIVINHGNIMKNIPYDLIVTSFETKLSKLIIRELVLQQKASKTSLKLSGEIENDRFNLSLKLNELVVAKRTIRGDIMFSGEKTDKDIYCKIVSPNLAIDNISNKFSATGSYNSEKIVLNKIVWGDAINGNLEYFVPSKYLSSDIDYEFDTEQLLNKDITGKITGKVTIRGNVGTPSVLTDYKYRGNIYNLLTRGSGKILVNQNILKIEDTKFLVNGSQAEVSGELDLGKREFNELNISANNVKMDSIYTLCKSTLPVSGVLKNLEVNIAGGFDNPQVSVGYSGENVYIEDKIIDSIDGKFTLLNKRIVFTKGNIKWGEAQIRILPDTYVDFKEEIVFKVISEIRNIKLPGIVLFGGVIAEGRWNNSIKADISTNGLWLNQLQLKNEKYYIEYSKGILNFIPENGKPTQITGIIDFSRPNELKIYNFSIFEAGKRLFFINGSQKDDNLEITSEGSNVSLGNILNLLNLKVVASGNTNFNVKVSGKIKDPAITCILNSTNGNIENIGFDIASLFFQINENILELKQLKISQKNIFSIEGEGKTPLPLTAEMKEKLSGYPIDILLKVTNGNMAILTALSKSVKSAKGQFSTLLNIKGTLEKPDVSGEFKATADEILMKDIFRKLTDFKCGIIFSGKKIEIQELNVLVEKEPLVLSGYAAITDGFNIGDFDVHIFTPSDGIAVIVNDLQIKSGGVGKIIPVIPDIATFSNPSKAKVKADMRFFGTTESWNIDGYMKISDAKFTYPGIGENEGAWDFLKFANWNLKIVTGKDCWYENDFASVEIKGELLLHDRGVSPHVSGKVEAVRGDLSYLGRDFTIKEAVFEAEKSKLFLSGIAESDTEVESRREDLATHQMIIEYIPDTIILTLDRGPLENVKPRFSSKTNPQMNEQLATQSALGLTDTKQKQPFSAEEISKMVDTFLTTPFVKSLFKKIGFIDKFSIKRDTSSIPLPQGTQPSIVDLYKGTKLSFGQSFARGLSANYGIKFDEFENKLSLTHEIQLSYLLKNGILFTTIQELNKDQYGDRQNKFLFEKYWRFGAEPAKKE